MINWVTILKKQDYCYVITILYYQTILMRYYQSQYFQNLLIISMAPN